MAIIGTFTQQPDDVLDYEVRYEQFLSPGDSVLSAIAVVEPAGLLVQTPIPFDNDTAVKIWVQGGVDGTTYQITVTTTTALGRVKQDELRMRIRDY